MTSQSVRPLQVFNAQVDTSKEEMEGGLEIVRYLQGGYYFLGICRNTDWFIHLYWYGPPG